MWLNQGVLDEWGMHTGMLHMTEGFKVLLSNSLLGKIKTM